MPPGLRNSTVAVHSPLAFVLSTALRTTKTWSADKASLTTVSPLLSNTSSGGVANNSSPLRPAVGNVTVKSFESKPRIALANVNSGTIASSLTSIDNVAIENEALSWTALTAMDTTVIAVCSPSDTWTVAVHSPNMSVLAFSTSPPIVAFIVCGFVSVSASESVVSFPKIIAGGVVNSIDSLALLSLTDNVNISPSRSVISVARRWSINGPASSSLMAGLRSVPVCPMTGARLGGRTTILKGRAMTTSSVENVPNEGILSITIVAVHSPASLGLSSPPLKNTLPRRSCWADPSKNLPTTWMPTDT